MKKCYEYYSAFDNSQDPAPIHNTRPESLPATHSTAGIEGRRRAASNIVPRPKPAGNPTATTSSYICITVMHFSSAGADSPMARGLEWRLFFRRGGRRPPQACDMGVCLRRLICQSTIDVLFNEQNVGGNRMKTEDASDRRWSFKKSE